MKKLQINKHDTIVVQMFEWYDAKNGNTYNALTINIVRKGGVIGTLRRGMEYGYGSAGSTAMQLMTKVLGLNGLTIHHLKEVKQVAWVVAAHCKVSKWTLERNWSNTLEWEGTVYKYDPCNFTGFHLDV